MFNSLYYKNIAITIRKREYFDINCIIMNQSVIGKLGTDAVETCLVPTCRPRTDPYDSTKR